jgi:hypothetical protein
VFFGWQVAISGNTAVVGSHNASAYVFERTGATWVEKAELTPAGSVVSAGAVAADGDAVVIGSWLDDSVVAGAGSANVYRRTSMGWQQEAQLTASDASAHANFGVSVAIRGDVIAVGAFAAGESGQAYLFTRIGGSWVESALVAPPGPAQGAQRFESLDGGTGRAHIFRISGTATSTPNCDPEDAGIADAWLDTGSDVVDAPTSDDAREEAADAGVDSGVEVPLAPPGLRPSFSPSGGCDCRTPAGRGELHWAWLVVLAIVASCRARAPFAARARQVTLVASSK